MCFLPCIASNIRGNTDALDDSEFMFSPKDCDSLVAHMERMLKAETRNLEAEKNKERVKSIDISEEIKAYKNVYQDLC